MKISKSNKGSKNKMYGKPAPQGSGNGWSGWYKGWYFRSLRELSYMVTRIERYKMIWKTAESKKYKIQYRFINSVYNYYADFVINNKYLLEIKPKRLWNTPKIKAKTKAAKIFCKKNNLIYKIIDCKIMPKGLLHKLVLEKDIIFLPRYQEKYKKFMEL